MPQMEMPRNWTVATVSGHTIRFRKNTPIHVPNDFTVLEECVKFGATYSNSSEEPVLPDEDAVVSTLPKTPHERKQRIKNLLGEMLENQPEHRNHFTAAGNPAVKYVNLALGFEVRSEEIKDVWTSLTRAPEVDDE